MEWLEDDPCVKSHDSVDCCKAVTYVSKPNMKAHVLLFLISYRDVLAMEDFVMEKYSKDLSFN